MRILTGGEGHESVVMMLWTGRLLGCGRRDATTRAGRLLTLAVAVAGCASTVGVRALSAATHDDDCDLVFGVVGEVVVGKID